jgi:hypothetical protein
MPKLDFTCDCGCTFQENGGMDMAKSIIYHYDSGEHDNTIEQIETLKEKRLIVDWAINSDGPKGPENPHLYILLRIYYI